MRRRGFRVRSEPLQFIPPLVLRRRATGDELVREHLPESRVVAAPTDADQVYEGLRFEPVGVGCGTPLGAASVGAEEHQMRYLVRMALGVDDRRRPALRHAEQREAPQLQAVDHRFQVGRPGGERELLDVAIR